MISKLTRTLLLIAALSFSSMALTGCGDDADTNGQDNGDNGNNGNNGNNGKDEDELCDPDSTEPLHACSEFTKNCTPFDNARVPLVDGEVPHP